MKKKRVVVFVYPKSVDVYLRIDHGHGQIEYKPLNAGVVREDPQPSNLLHQIGSLLISALVAIFGGQ